ncbi:hypothetical protein V8G54_032678 [Vigna mungo]|uniref:Uncharacterized protein n=1 Tax=Vigna mungo TaxID=3915 RepID=A0AAQ3MMF0_VIGMU
MQSLQSDEAWHRFHHHPPFPTAIIKVHVKTKNCRDRDKNMNKKKDNTNLIRSLLSTKAPTIKEKSNGVEINRLSVTISIHKLFQLSAPLDPEEHFVPILQHPVKISFTSRCLGDDICLNMLQEETNKEFTL